LRVYFANENDGWAACNKKTVLVTHDGGRKWEPIKAASDPPGAPERSAYSWVAFANRNYGIIFGFNQPAMRWGAKFPAWMDPEDALSRRETPHCGGLPHARDAHFGRKSVSPESTRKWRIAAAGMSVVSPATGSSSGRSRVSGSVTFTVR